MLNRSKQPRCKITSGFLVCGIKKRGRFQTSPYDEDANSASVSSRLRRRLQRSQHILRLNGRLLIRARVALSIALVNVLQKSMRSAT